MDWQRLRAETENKVPCVDGRELSLLVDRDYRGPLHERQRRGGSAVHYRDAMATMRARIVVQEMRRVYDRLCGVGDHLVEARLPALRLGERTVAELSRIDLDRFNDDLAALAASIFGEDMAVSAHAHIASLIKQVYA